MKSIFLEAVGDNFRNKVIEYFVECRELDVAISDIIERYNLNKATTYNLIKELLKKEIIKPTRKVGNTQLYKINRDNVISIALINLFDACLDSYVDDFTQKQAICVKVKTPEKNRKR